MSCYRHEGAWYVRDRHQDGCTATIEVEPCSGCEPCDRHCTCRAGCKQHVDEAHPLTAPACIGRVRGDIRAIVELAALLPGEAEHQGVDSEAANLAGPAADAEAWSNRKVSANAGRKWHASLLEEDDEAHPLRVLGTWDFMIREDYDQPTALRATVSRCADYLDQQLGRIAQDDEQDFPLLAREMRACRARLEAVLHDGRQGERAGVGCFDCGAILERRQGDSGFEDWWTCAQCRRRYSHAEYAFALKANLQDVANREHQVGALTAAELGLLYGVKPARVRKWVERGQLAQMGKNAAGKMTYDATTARRLIGA